MESDRSTTRTYTANTCELIVSGQELEVASDRQPPEIEPTDFRLHLHHSEGSELDRLTLQGNPQQLHQLQQVVSTYITDLVGKFPIPVAIDALTPSGDRPDQRNTEPEVHVARAEPSARDGILKNLPGLRNSQPVEGKVDERSGVSKMFDLQHQPADRAATKVSVDTTTSTTPSAQLDRQTPYLTGSGDRSLDHCLHLGDLATEASGEAIKLSALQLFDLAIVLDDYANANLSPVEQQRAARLSRTLFQSDPTTAQNTDLKHQSRRSTPPKGNVEPAEHPIYYRNRRSRPSFMSAVPWAIATAMAVGIPFAMLDPNPNPIKDVANKIKMPDLAAGKKSGVKPGTATEATKTDGNTNSIEAKNPTATLPAPWQAQPVEPPVSKQPATTSTPITTPTAGKLGSAPLPESLAGNLGQTVSPATTPNSSTKTPTNPLESNPIPPNLSGSPAATAKPQNTTANPGNPVAAKSGSTTKPTKPAPLQIGQLPIDTPNSGKISISKQPALLPPADLSPSVPTAPVKPVPFNQPGVDESGRIDPFDRPTTPKKNDRSKPAITTKPKSKPGKSQSSALNPSPNDPFTPVPKNPNLIDPNESSNTENTGPQVQPIVPDRPLQSKSATDTTENSPTLQEAKSYFQGKWKATPTQSSALQYVLQVNKNGTVKSISPQGEAATTYLQETKLIKPGQKLVAPSGNSDQKIRVLLQPDGGVDTFIEP